MRARSDARSRYFCNHISESFSARGANRQQSSINSKTITERSKTVSIEKALATLGPVTAAVLISIFSYGPVLAQPAAESDKSSQPLPSVTIQEPERRSTTRNAPAQRSGRSSRRRANTRPTTPPQQVAIPLQVQSGNNSPWGPVNGYVATNSLTGTKTNTPLIETPQSVSIVTRDQIDAQNSGSTKDALRYTAGIDSTNRANFYSTDIMYSRGFILNRFVDGLKLQGDNATAMAPQEELYGIERVEVLRGPSSILYGQSSPGGIVNLVSKRPTATPFADLMLQYGSFDQKNVGFDLGGAVDKNNQYQVRLTGFLHDANNQVDFVKEQRAFIMPSFTWQPTKDTTLTIIAKYQHDPFAGLYNFVPYVGSVAPNPLGQVPTSFYAGDPSYNTLNRTQSSVTSLFEHRFDDVFTVRQNMRYQDRKSVV